MSRPFPSRSSSQHSGVRVNGKIRAREVRVVGHDGQQLGVFSLVDAINMARAQGVDLVEVAPNAQPPVCRVVDYGKYRYEQNKKDKDAKKHQHANKVKEVQLSPKIELHDFGVKLSHAIDFLCEEMKVKVVLKFRGREMAHKEVGFEQIQKFTREIAPFGNPDNTAKVVGRSITVMFSPLPRNKRAKNPRGEHSGGAHMTDPAHDARPDEDSDAPEPGDAASPKGGGSPGDFANNPFTGIEIKPPE